MVAAWAGSSIILCSDSACTLNGRTLHYGFARTECLMRVVCFICKSVHYEFEFCSRSLLAYRLLVWYCVCDPPLSDTVRAVSAFCFYLSWLRIINTNAWNKLLLSLGWASVCVLCAPTRSIYTPCLCAERASLYFCYYNFYGLAFLELRNLSSSFFVLCFLAALPFIFVWSSQSLMHDACSVWLNRVDCLAAAKKKKKKTESKMQKWKMKQRALTMILSNIQDRAE